MKGKGTAHEIARWVALACLFLIPLAPLIVVNGFYFPFITGKAFYLRVLIEVLVAAWVALALLDKAYRPRFSWIGVVVVAFVVWMGIADSFAPNAAKAFWSNFERMEGWVLLAHLLGFFFASSAILRAEKKWRTWFYVSIGVAVVISLYALLQLVDPRHFPIHQGSTRIDASLGNSAYLAIYLLFTACVAVWLALTETRNWFRWSLVAFAALQVVLIFFTATRGTIVGVALALGLSALLVLATGSKRARLYAVGALALLVLTAGGLYAARDTAFVKNNEVLGRAASISLSSLETRFVLWGMAWEGVKERPLVGWGQEGFNYVFNKYYDPSLYRQEPWFDRAHNTFIDWLSAGGIPAFLLYVGLFVAAIVALWRPSLGRGSAEASTPNARSFSIARPERIALTAALVGYAVHNMAVFDNVYSYIYFFAILAFIDSQVARKVPKLESLPEVAPETGTTYALPIAAVLAFALVWTVNVPGARTASGLIQALSTGDPALYEELARRPSFAKQEVREEVVKFAAEVVRHPSIPVETKQQIAVFAITEMQKHAARYPSDARARMQLSYAYRLAGDLENAYREVEAAIELSPRKPHFHAEAGIVAWDKGDPALADRHLAHAYSLAPQFPELAVYAVVGKIALGNLGEARKIMEAAYGTSSLDQELLLAALARAKQWEPLIEIMRQRTEKEGAGPEAWVALASVYYDAGDLARAVATLRTAARRFPAVAPQLEAAIKEVTTAR